MAQRVLMALLLFVCWGQPGCDVDDGSTSERDTGAVFDVGELPAAGPPGSCTSEAGCTDYTGVDWTPVSVQGTCTLLPGRTWSPEPCGEGDWVGRCVVAQGRGNEMVVQYGALLFTPAGAQRLCELAQGVWSST